MFITNATSQPSYVFGRPPHAPHPPRADKLQTACAQQSMGAGATDAAVCTHHAKGGAGATELGKAVQAACKQAGNFKFLYGLDLPLKVQCYC